MSSMSLEERRAERRRRRQMEEETSHSGIRSADEIHADIQERLARRRKERDERIASLAASVATVNGEDDLERRRRERREQRLRASGDTDYTSTDDYSSRRNRRRGTDDYTSEDTSSYSSYRSRRNRNWDDDEETPTVNEVSSVPDTSEEDRRRQRQQEEEEEARRQAEREAEEERQREAALEEERRREAEARRREEEERQRQEEARRLAEEERQRQEEEERRRGDDEFESESEGSIEKDNYKHDNRENKLFIEEDDLVTAEDTVDKFERVRQWNEHSNHVNNVERQNHDNLWIKHESAEKSRSVDKNGGLFIEINNNKIRDKLDKFEHLKDESDSPKTVISRSVVIPHVEKDGLKGKLEKFEKEIKEQEDLAKDVHRQPKHARKLEVSTTQPKKLTNKVQQFETVVRSQSTSKPSSVTTQFGLRKIGGALRQRQTMLGRWSASESHINRTEIRDVPKKNVLDRWKSVDKPNQHTPIVTSPTEKSEQLNKRLSGNTEFIASKYLEKASKSVEEPQILKSPISVIQKTSLAQSFEQRITSHSSGTQSDVSEDAPVKQSRVKITTRWPFNEENENIKSTPKVGQSVNQSRGIHSRESSSDHTHSHSRGSSIDGSSESSKRSLYHHQQEEEEEERLREEKEARMAAEEGQKKRTKRKGLGGLTPEKKKKLKQIIMQKAAEDLKKEALAKAQEKEKFINDRVGPLNTDGLGEAELRKLIKSLHEKLAQIHSEAYDIEFKLNKQEKEIVDLNMKISDSRGKFAKPVLRKVNKTEQKFAKMSKQAESKQGDFRETLLSAHDDDAN